MLRGGATTQSRILGGKFFFLVPARPGYAVGKRSRLTARSAFRFLPTEPLLGPSFDLGRENRKFITPVRCQNTFLRNILPFIRLFLVFITNGNILLGGGITFSGGGNDILTGGKALLGGGIIFPSGGNDVFTGGRALLGGGNELSEHIRNIFTEGELREEQVVWKIRTTAVDGKKYLEFAELQALNRTPMYMCDGIARLDNFLKLVKSPLLLGDLKSMCEIDVDSRG